ncbi:MAG: TlpA family protein disulfide reductase [Prevotella sp.]
MKQFFLFLFSFLFVLCPCGEATVQQDTLQGIRFVPTLSEALQLQTATGKPIFADVYTKWCGPCRHMAATTFQDTAVASYFNRNFICVKVDAESPEGRPFARTHGVSSYPTLIFLDTEGQVLTKAVGAKNADALLQIARQCPRAASGRLAELSRRYVRKKLSSTELQEYMALLQENNLPAVEPLADWIRSLPQEEATSRTTFQTITRHQLEPGDSPFQYILEHYAAFAHSMDTLSLNRYLFSTAIFAAYQEGRAAGSPEAVWKSMETAPSVLLHALKETYQLVTYLLPDTSQHNAFVQGSRAVTKAFPLCAPAIAMELCKHAYGSNTLLAEYAKELLPEIARNDSLRAAWIAHSYVCVLLVNTAEYRLADYWVQKYQEWSGNPLYQQSTTLRVKRALGLEPCQDYGRDMPDFLLPASDGTPVSLASLRGQYVLLDFWASWCGPCMREMPRLKEAYSRYAQQGIKFVGVNCDEHAVDFTDALQRLELPWLQLAAKAWPEERSGDYTDILKDYGVRTIPRVMLIDPQGRLVGDNLTGELLFTTLDRIVQENATH